MIQTLFGAIVVVSSVIHTLLIEGTMEPTSKTMLNGPVLVVTIAAIVHLRIVRPLRQSRGH